MQTTNNCSDCGSKILLDASILTNTISNLDLMCNDCAFQLIKTLEFKTYEALKKETESTSKDEVKPDSLQALQEANNKAIQLLKTLETQEANVDQELEQVEKELEELQKEEEIYWHLINSLEVDQMEYQANLQSLSLQVESQTARLELLSKTNVFNDAVDIIIWHDGPFGTINGLRLGRLPSKMVEWPEINAAIGQTALLLDVVSQRINFTFKNYRIIPSGSFSKIEKFQDPKATFELYGSSDFTGIFSNRRFDLGMVCFLDCLAQMGDFAEQKDLRFKLPYKIDKDRIGDASIKLQFNQDQDWTRALKYMLIDVKWMLAFCCSSG